jgi:hypothetical protein
VVWGRRGAAGVSGEVLECFELCPVGTAALLPEVELGEVVADRVAFVGDLMECVGELGVVDLLSGVTPNDPGLFEVELVAEPLGMCRSRTGPLLIGERDSRAACLVAKACGFAGNAAQVGAFLRRLPLGFEFVLTEREGADRTHRSRV